MQHCQGSQTHTFINPLSTILAPLYTQYPCPGPRPALQHTHTGKIVWIQRVKKRFNDEKIGQTALFSCRAWPDKCDWPCFTCSQPALLYSFLCIPLLFYLFALLLRCPLCLCRALQLTASFQSGALWFLPATMFILPASGACRLLAHQIVWLRSLFLVIVYQLGSPQSDNPVGINIPTFSPALLS